METFKLNDMVKGWFVGDFNPTIYNTENVEVAVKIYNKNDYDEKHYHKLSTEITVVANGKVLMNNIERNSGDIIRLDPYDSTDCLVLEDNTILIAVKVPASKNDKYLGEATD